MKPTFPDFSAWPMVVTLKALAMLAIMTAGLAVAGCASSQVAIPNPVDIDTTEYDRIFQASVDVLRDQGFRIDRQDYRFGVITTHPRKSPTLVEPWHRDNLTLGHMMDSTSNHLRRRVHLRMIPGQTPMSDAQDAASAGAENASDASEGDTIDTASVGYLFEAQVVIEQVETPRRFLTGSTRPEAMFAQLRTMPAELAGLEIESDYWRPIGRDEPLEQRLVAQILRRSVELAHHPH